MVRPDRTTFKELARQRATVPVVREVLADLDTPLASFIRLDDGKTAFLFESVEDEGRWGRYSIVGLGARATLCAQGGRVEIRRGTDFQVHELPADRSVDPLEQLRSLLGELSPAHLPDLPPFAGGAVGFLSYDWVRYVERLPEKNPDTLAVPEAFFTFPDTLVVHDRQRDCMTLIRIAEVGPEADVDRVYDAAVAELDRLAERLSGPLPTHSGAVRLSQDRAHVEPAHWESNVSREEFHDAVKRAREYIEAGDIFQVVPSQRLSLPLRCDPLRIYRWLRVVNPSPYLFFMRAGHRVILGSSPEVLARLEGQDAEGRSREIALRPIAGTRPRGDTLEEDLEHERALLADPKELAEHIMLVDLGRNDVGRVAETGSVRVDQLQVIERYSHVMHIVSNVRGRLREDCDAIDLLRAVFPAGTLSGAPKVRAMEIIEELESERRGLYGGAVGYIDYYGRMDMCIAIRTMLIQDDRIYVQAGAGIVADSDPDREYEETLQKASALIRAIELAQAEVALVEPGRDDGSEGEGE